MPGVTHVGSTFADELCAGADRDRSDTGTARAASAKILAEVQSETDADRGRDSASGAAQDDEATRPSIKHLSQIFTQDGGESRKPLSKQQTQSAPTEPDPTPPALPPKKQAMVSAQEGVIDGDTESGLESTAAQSVDQVQREEGGEEEEELLYDNADAALEHLLDTLSPVSEDALSQTTAPEDFQEVAIPRDGNLSNADEDGARRPSMGSASLRKARMRNSAMLFNNPEDVERNSGSFSDGASTGASDEMKCIVCSKTAYAMERIIADKKVFHKSCFRCAVPECNKVCAHQSRA